MRRLFKSTLRGRSVSKEPIPDGGNDEAIAPKASEADGLHLLHEDLPEKDETGRHTYEVDIVAVHGLNGTPFGTWTKEIIDDKTRKKTSTLWLRDLLPKDIPGARIFTYGYPSKLFFSKSKATTEDYAQMLLFSLKAERKNGKERRPLIFVAHSLGGLVCKQALIRAYQNQDFHDILTSTQAVLFFGTPHRGASGTPELAAFLGNVFDKVLKISGAGIFKGRVNTDLLEGLKANAAGLSRISEAFSHLCKPPLTILTIYETEEQPPLGQLIVQKSSAVMDVFVEKQIPGNACHREICRFKGYSDPMYRIISSEMIDLCKKACYVPSLRDSERACVRLFNGPLMDAYRSSLPKRVHGTCQWILNHPQFRSWVGESQASLLWVTGHSGSGKTTLSSYITETLGHKEKASRADPIVCCFFCVDGIQEQRDATAILRSLIFQLLTERRDLIRHVKSSFDYDRDGTHIPKSYDRLWSIFDDLLCDNDLGPVSIILDAIDECEKSSRKRLMENIAELIDSLRSKGSRCVRFLITSRPSSLITSCFTGYKPQHLPLEEQGREIEEDLRLVIHQRVGRIATRIEAKQDTIALMERSLAENADRTFLWLKFALDILDDGLPSSPGDFRRILAELPRDLEQAYEHYLQRIPRGQEELAVNIFRLVIASVRPLSLDEINTAVSLHDASSRDCHSLEQLKKEHFRTKIEADIWQVLGSLIRISDRKVYLVHLSLKEYLCNSILSSSDERTSGRYHVESGEANMFLASACMRYLVLDDFSEDLYSKANVNRRYSPSNSSESSQSEKQAESESEEGSEDDYGMFGNMLQEKAEVDAATCARLARRYTFFDYSATRWAKHFALGQTSADAVLQNLALRLSDKTMSHVFENWFRFFWTSEMFPLEYPSTFDQVVTASFFDHYTILEMILSRTGMRHQESPPNALYWASRCGHSASVSKILRTVMDPGIDDQRSLKVAAEFGNLEVVRVLNTDSRVVINSGTSDGTSPLLKAAKGGHVDVVRFLLNEGSTTADCVDFQGKTALHWAIQGSHCGAAEVLIRDHRVNINSVDKDGRTPFSLAAEKGVDQIIESLLQQPNIDVDSPNSKGRTPLSFAAEFGHPSVLKSLARSKKLNTSHPHKDHTGRNAYSWAASSGHDTFIQRLQRYKMPGIDEEDEFQWTPLFWALEAPTSTTVKVLLESGAVAVNRRDHSGRTALSWIVSYGKEGFFHELLNAAGVDPLIEDNGGLTSLDWARKLERPYFLSMLEEFVSEDYQDRSL